MRERHPPQKNRESLLDFLYWTLYAACVAGGLSMEIWVVVYQLPVIYGFMTTIPFAVVALTLRR